MLKHITNITNIWVMCILYIPCQLYSQAPFIDKAPDYSIDHIYNGFQASGGVSCVDFNQDGLDDISLASANGQTIKFYLNTGMNNFQQLDLLGTNSSDIKQILWIDFDNDGDKDLFVAAFDGVNKLYENKGELNLVDVSITVGLPQDSTRSFGANFADYNRDGWLDLYYVQRKINSTSGPNENRLFKNNAGSFDEVSLETNSSDFDRLPFCSVFADFNNDKWPDIYIANDRDTRNTLLLNLAGFFADASEVSKSDLEISAMCTAIGDYNRDGLMDIYVTNLPEGNKFLVNDIDSIANPFPVFKEMAEELDIAVNGNCWGAVFLDGNNDGFLDLYVSNALVGSETTQSVYYAQNQNGEFIKSSEPLVGDTVASYNNAVGDFNADGFPDIVVQNQSPYNTNLWVNQNNENNWMKLKLEGIKSNKDGIGSRLELYTDRGYQQLYTTAAIGFLGQNSDTYIFGLNDSELIDSLVITWPTGHIDVHKSMNANQTYLLYEGQSTNDEIFVDSEISILEINPTSTFTDETKEFFVKCYPNPSNSIISINTNVEFENCKITILDSNGNKAIKQEQNLEIDVSNLSNGIYIILLKFDEKIYSKKFIKIH